MWCFLDDRGALRWSRGISNWSQCCTWNLQSDLLFMPQGRGGGEEIILERYSSHFLGSLAFHLISVIARKRCFWAGLALTDFWTHCVLPHRVSPDTMTQTFNFPEKRLWCRRQSDRRKLFWYLGCFLDNKHSVFFETDFHSHFFLVLNELKAFNISYFTFSA